jgi:hypothetical protein
MTEISISTLALAICMIPGILHSLEVAFPMLARLIVNYVLPLFEPGLPKGKNQMTADEQTTMLDAAIASAPEGKKTAAKDYIFLLLFEQRQNSLAFLGGYSRYHLRFSIAIGRARDATFLISGDVCIVYVSQCQSCGYSFFGSPPESIQKWSKCRYRVCSYLARINCT